MNRKRAISSILFLGTGVLVTVSGIRWYRIYKAPEIGYLEDHKNLLADLAEIIIPRTSTPGAKDVKAHEIILTLIKNTADRKTQNNFIEGLKEVESYSLKTFNLNFSSLNQKQQITVVKYLFETGKNYSGILGKVKNKFLGKSFFDILKYYTTVAFCTSELGATEALAFDYIPGKYLACTDLSVNQRSWATK
jgi:hypothetical protein